MLDKNNLIALAKQVARADRSAPISYSFNGENFSYAEMNEALRMLALMPIIEKIRKFYLKLLSRLLTMSCPRRWRELILSLLRLSSSPRAISPSLDAREIIVCVLSSL